MSERRDIVVDVIPLLEAEDYGYVRRRLINVINEIPKKERESNEKYKKFVTEDGIKDFLQSSEETDENTVDDDLNGLTLEVLCDLLLSLGYDINIEIIDYDRSP